VADAYPTGFYATKHYAGITKDRQPTTYIILRIYTPHRNQDAAHALAWQVGAPAITFVGDYYRLLLGLAGRNIRDENRLGAG
jgi:hypothetical protein